MARKRIGVLLAQANETTQNHFMQGFLQEAFASDYDVLIFSMYVKYQQTNLRELGESNIYELINYDMLSFFFWIHYRQPVFRIPFRRKFTTNLMVRFWSLIRKVRIFHPL